MFAGIDKQRLPMKYLASLFTNGDTNRMGTVMKRLLAVKIHRRDVTVGDYDKWMSKKQWILLEWMLILQMQYSD
jgi:nitrate reductase beta subunit